MKPTAEQIEAVRKTWPGWTDMQIERHLKDRAALSERFNADHRAAVDAALRRLAAS